jgi:hypothetical protein
MDIKENLLAAFAWQNFVHLVFLFRSRSETD